MGSIVQRHPASGLLVAIAWLPLGCYSWAPVTTARTTPSVRVVPGDGDAVWKDDVGWERPRLGTWGASEHLRAEALKAFQADAHADALEGFLVLKGLGPADPAFAAEVDFHIGECYYHLGEYELALVHYRLVYRRGRPGQAILSTTFDRIYTIGLDYLWGRAGASFLFKFVRYRGSGHGVDILAGTDPGQEGIVTDYPYLAFADDALMEIARYYYESEDYGEAERWYKRVVDEYPRRELSDQAQYQFAMSLYKQIRGVDYEHDAMVDADRAFRRYLDDNPRGRSAEEARAKLRDLAEMQGESYLNKAKYYLRESQLAAARIYLRIILDRYTTTEAAMEAREISGQIERVEAGRG